MTPEHQAAETALRVALAKIDKLEREAYFWRAATASFVATSVWIWVLA